MAAKKRKKATSRPTKTTAKRRVTKRGAKTVARPKIAAKRTKKQAAKKTTSTKAKVVKAPRATKATPGKRPASAAAKAGKAPSPGFQFLLDSLKANRAATFAELREEAKKKGIVIHPISYGRVQTLLGIVKMSPRGKGKAKTRAARIAAGASTRGRPRVARSSASNVEDLSGLISSLKRIERERDDLRAAAEKIQALLNAF